MKPPWIPWLLPAAFVTFAVAGWQAGEEESEPPTSPVVRPAPTKHSQRGTRTVERGGLPAEVAAKLAPIRTAPTPVERLRATIELANSLPVSALDRWYTAEWFDFHDGMDANLFSRITRSRWLAEDPQGLMAHCLRRNSEKTHEVAGLWVKRDPQAALAFVESTGDPEDLRRLASAMAGPLAAADPVLALTQVVKWQARLGNDSESVVEEMIRGLAKVSPELLANESSAWSPLLQGITIRELDGISLRRDFSGTVASLSKNPAGKSRFLQAISRGIERVTSIRDHAVELPEGWFKEAATRYGYYLTLDDPAGWLETDLGALGLNDEQALQLRSQAASSLASKDYQAALKLLEGKSLGANERQDILGSALGQLAWNDPAAAEAWVARLTDPGEVQQASQILESVAGRAAVKAPPSPAEWLSQLPDQPPGAMWLFLRKSQSWDREQIAAVGEAFRELPEDQRTSIAGLLASSSLREAPFDLQGEALRYLLEQPQPVANPSVPGASDSHQRMNQVSELASSWAAQDPLAGGRWVRSLPEGDARLQAAKILAAQWADYEPAAARQWVSSLPTGDRFEVVDYLDRGAASK